MHSWQSPAGELLLGAYCGQLCLCLWSADNRLGSTLNRTCRILGAEMRTGMTDTVSCSIRELEEFFGGSRQCFTTEIVLAGTDFQQSVWRQLLHIPYGTTMSYSDVAAGIGHPTAVRATANAVATNPISIFVPCHRVMGRNHALTGYAGGLAAKELLLDTERHGMPFPERSKGYELL